MRALTVICTAALLTSIPNLLSAAAPTPPQTSASPAEATVTADRDQSLNCPVGFEAHRQSPSELVVVGSGSSPRHSSGQGVHLSLGRSANPIASADVVIHAVSARRRLLPLESSTSDPDLSRDFHLSGPAKGLRSSDLWLDDAGSILSVDLLSMTFADGSTWKRQPALSCRATISGYLLVSSR